jgi:uncharacterized protein
MASAHFDRLVKAMLQEDFYPHPTLKIEKRETHISIVFLSGYFVYKIKKPVNLQFLDFTDLEKRHLCCRAELELNQRLSSNIYLEVLPITFSDQSYQLKGNGEIVEYAVKMVQLDDQKRLDRYLLRGRIDPAIFPKLAQKLARFYQCAPSTPQISASGAWNIVWKNCEENFEQIEQLNGKRIIEGALLQIVHAATRSFLSQRKDLFERRVVNGKIKDCHGDLKTEHIYVGTQIQIIDCIEFNDRFRFSDISADLAFLAMDLDFKGQHQLAQDFIDSFLRYYDDPELLVLITFYKCYRAMVRIKVNLFHINNLRDGSYQKHVLERETKHYLKLAYQYAAQFTRPTVWVVCGLPASGKSTLASALSNALNLKILSSDITRKQLFNLQPNHPEVVNFADGIYSETATALTYGKILLLSQEHIEKGQSIIIDATYSRKSQRMELIRFARDMDVNLIFIHCKVPLEILRKRLRKREIQADVSDAREYHLKAFIKKFEPMDEIDSKIYLEVDTEAPAEENIKKILNLKQFHQMVLVRRIKNRLF